MSLPLKKVYVICNSGKEHAQDYHNTLRALLQRKGVEEVDTVAQSDFAIVIGGDGTLLNFAHHNVDYVKPIAAINMGSLGFLTDVRTSESEKMLDILISGEYKSERRNFLELKVDGVTHYALNDAVLSKAGAASRMVTVHVHVNEVFLNTYRADGIIIASPTGSTAYSLSCGGPIMVPGLEAIVITPIAVHNLNARPIVLSKNDAVSLTIEQDQGEAQLMFDGQIFSPFSQTSTLQVCLSQKYIQPVLFPGRTFFSVLREKLRWGDGPVYNGDNRK